MGHGTIVWYYGVLSYSIVLTHDMRQCIHSYFFLFLIFFLKNLSRNNCKANRKKLYRNLFSFLLLRKNRRKNIWISRHVFFCNRWRHVITFQSDESSLLHSRTFQGRCNKKKKKALWKLCCNLIGCCYGCNFFYLIRKRKKALPKVRLSSAHKKHCGRYM